MRHIATAVAAIALLAGAAHAQGNGKANGNQGGGKAAPTSMQGGGNGNHGNGNGKAANHGNADAMTPARGPDNRGGNNMQASAPRADRANPGKANGNGPKAGPAVRAANGQGNGNGKVANNGNADRVVRAQGNNRNRGADFSFISSGNRGLIDGCPPGLAKKNPPCVPPGQARNDQRRLFAFDRPDWWGLSRLGDGRYFYNDGYLMRLGSDGRIGGYIPLLGGALSVGNAWPSYYPPVRLPDYYSDYYNLGPYDAYRYADDVVYRVDPQTSAITSIAALLTGDDFSVGQPLPRGYDVYNVPYGYRDQYVDSPDSLYRYSDGYVYQVDPGTRLIAAAIELIAS